MSETEKEVLSLKLEIEQLKNQITNKCGCGATRGLSMCAGKDGKCGWYCYDHLYTGYLGDKSYKFCASCHLKYTKSNKCTIQ